MSPEITINSVQLTQASLPRTAQVQAVDQKGERRAGEIAQERPLTLYLDKQELVTVMTIGAEPELLALGWLKNQRIIERVQQIKAVQVDWETESAVVVSQLEQSVKTSDLGKKTVTTGCGQGTMYGDLMDYVSHLTLPKVTLKQSMIYALLARLASHNEIYKRAGAVHGCALCVGDEIIKFVEDVGRHNAVDALAGHMLLHELKGDDIIFYTTGRLTSEMVIKVALMGVPILLSRSGITQMGLDIAQQLGVVLIARAKGKHFLVYHGEKQIEFDQV